MITDAPINDVGQQLVRMRSELNDFKEVVANAVSRLNARINALERCLPPPKACIRRQVS
jgi:hypothetical protein